MSATTFPTGQMHSPLWDVGAKSFPSWGGAVHRYIGPLQDGPFIFMRAERRQGDQCDATCRLSTHEQGTVDVSIEEYVGVSRRAKLVSFRLEEPSARVLYEMLKARFEPDAINVRDDLVAALRHALYVMGPGHEQAGTIIAAIAKATGSKA